MGSEIHWLGKLYAGNESCGISLRKTLDKSFTSSSHLPLLNLADHLEDQSHIQHSQFKASNQIDDFIEFTPRKLARDNHNSSSSLRMETFFPLDGIQWQWLDQAYVIDPNYEFDSYDIIKQNLDNLNVAAIVQINLENHSHIAAIDPRGAKMLLWTLRQKSSIQSTDIQIDHQQRNAMLSAEILKNCAQWRPSI